jgi:hypothetical protein
MGFKSEILPLFTQMDIDHMRQHGVELDSYDYMKVPDHATAVLGQVVQQKMPPPESGEDPWPMYRCEIFMLWMASGFQP